VVVNANSSPPPTVSSISPTSGAEGTSVTVDGTNFSTSGGTTIAFGGSDGTSVDCPLTTQCTVDAPAGSGEVAVTVTVASQSSTPNDNSEFTYTSCTPEISSVSTFDESATQTITIDGTCFGSSSALSEGTTEYLGIHDQSQGWAACHTDDAITCSVSSWTNTQIVFTGFSGQFGEKTYNIGPGDEMEAYVWNPSSDNESTGYINYVSGSCSTSAPSIDSIAPGFNTSEVQTVTIYGTCLGAQSPFTDSSNSDLSISDTTATWSACNTGDLVTCSVSSWSANTIVFTGFSGDYDWEGILYYINVGDSITVKVTNGSGNSASKSVVAT
jgi:hypothetical protein